MEVIIRNNFKLKTLVKTNNQFTVYENLGFRTMVEWWLQRVTFVQSSSLERWIADVSTVPDLVICASIELNRLAMEDIFGGAVWSKLIRCFGIKLFFCFAFAFWKSSRIIFRGEFIHAIS